MQLPEFVRSLPSHESFISYFISIFLKKLHEADLLLVRNIFVPTFAKNSSRRYY